MSGSERAVVRISARGSRHAAGGAAEASPEELRRVVETAVRLLAEVLAGVREPRHLAWWAMPGMCEKVAAHRLPAAGARVPPPRVLRTWVQRPVPDVAEAGAVVTLDGRVQALALRLERRNGRWRCAAVETTLPRPPARALRRAG
ncbi:Rv3235 family protein [Actinomadura kijaniata]|uniref:Rv3235 family protein n=1 Tax=Actinomadura kijaniata TaxID=46161 RepID=UPI00083708B5|nr:Rv3235 family protein [Actinomadura kijaniata]